MTASDANRRARHCTSVFEGCFVWSALQTGRAEGYDGANTNSYLRPASVLGYGGANPEHNALALLGHLLPDMPCWHLRTGFECSTLLISQYMLYEEELMDFEAFPNEKTTLSLILIIQSEKQQKL